MIYDFTIYGVMVRRGWSYRIWRYDKRTHGVTRYGGTGNIPCEVVSTGGAGYVSMSRNEHYFREHILYRHRPFR